MSNRPKATRIYGVDFTSRPTKAKPITCAVCSLSDSKLTLNSVERWPAFDAFDNFLNQEGPWIAGLDFPFAQARRFVDNIGWPKSWVGCAEEVRGFSRPEFRELLDDYRDRRQPGDKEHRRRTDVISGAVSSQKLYGVPVALMFYEGVPRLLGSGVHIPVLRETSSDAVVLEAYPGKLARRLIGRQPYKQDAKDKQTSVQRVARENLLNELRGAGWLGFDVEVEDDIVDDPKADSLDALLCAVQAAWASRQERFGIPFDIDPLEGWIVGPD